VLGIAEFGASSDEAGDDARTARVPAAEELETAGLEEL
jgi:hypothetical protein